MKLLLFLTPLVFVACAPRAILLAEAKEGPVAREPSAPAASEPEADEDTQPGRPADDLGLLEPRSLSNVPDEREMRPTVDPDEKPAVIATPPVSE